VSSKRTRETVNQLSSEVEREKSEFIYKSLSKNKT
jgi:hypothetical protein